MKKQETPKASEPTKTKCAIAVVDAKGKVVKAFRAWAWDSGNGGKVIITRKNKETGEVEKVPMEFRNVGGSAALQRAMWAVVKFWKPFDPQQHRVTIMSREAAGLAENSETNVDPKPKKR